MAATTPTIGFAGDLSDPWVAAIARALSQFKVVSCREPDGGLPARAFDPDSGVGILVMHRSRLSTADVSRLEALRRDRGPDAWPRIVLCVSPYIRYAEIERCAPLVETVIPEATAADVLPSQIERMLERSPGGADRSRRGSTAVEVVSTDYELRRVLREAVAHAGFQATDADDPTPGPDGRALTVWDVPTLEPRWEERLERRCLAGPVLALLGFADRAAVSQARQAGAAVCLDLPCALDDLIDALDRMSAKPHAHARPRAEPAHATPPGPVARPRMTAAPQTC